MNTNNSRPVLSNIINSQTTQSNSSHQFANQADWWLDFWTMAGRKSQNQDSLLAVSILMGQGWTGPTPMLVLLADGVSASQFPKKASTIAVNTIAESIVNELPNLAEPSLIDANKTELDDTKVAALIKKAVTLANDAMYFSQSYQRVPPLLSTLSGVLCIGDRIHLMHTGDSRVYRVSVDNLTVLSLDHRINHGQDKGALSAALGADAFVEVYQRVFVLSQHEYLALMTDGVYEFIDMTEMQFEMTQALASLEDAVATLSNSDLSNENNKNINESLFADFMSKWRTSHLLCEHALNEGSNDNLSIIMLGILPKIKLMPHASGDASHVGVAVNKQTTTLNNKSSAMTKANENQTPSPDTDQNLVSPTQHCDQTFSQENGLAATQSASKKTPQSAQLSSTINTTQYKLPTGLNIGDSVDGFKVMNIIDRTARSEVYLVHDRDGHEYVLKSPSLGSVNNGDYLRSFLKERKIGLSLSKNRRAGETAYNQNNPNQPKVYKSQEDSAQVGAGLSDTGLLRYYPVPASSEYLYHLTEFVDGESLRKFMERHDTFDVWQTHDLLTKIGMAVRVMHRNYLLHQDIKPENIILTKNGAVKLIDFGSAGSSILKDSTRPPGGDLHYAAPEYYTDEPKGVHSDLFSIAAIGYELLTGELPFSTQELMNPSSSLVLPTTLLRAKQVPLSSQQALIRAMHRKINVRYLAIGEFLQEFNPDNTAFNSDPEPLIKRNPLLVWHGICLLQFIIIVVLLIKFLPT